VLNGFKWKFSYSHCFQLQKVAAVKKETQTQTKKEKCVVAKEEDAFDLATKPVKLVK